MTGCSVKITAQKTPANCKSEILTDVGQNFGENFTIMTEIRSKFMKFDRILGQMSVKIVDFDRHFGQNFGQKIVNGN